ncbi:hypothetical protein OG216_43910 [Streptomycetaceae bacterium NBC_01309]
MTDENVPFELRPGWRVGDFVVVGGCLLVMGAGFVPAVPLGIAVAMWVLPGLLALLVVLSRVRAPVTLRLDATGMTLGNPFGADVVVPWSDVDAVVTWNASKGGNFVGVSAGQDYRDRTGLSRKRLNRFIDDAIGMPVGGTVIRWDGPDSDVKHFAAAAARLAPGVPFVDTASRRAGGAEAGG